MIESKYRLTETTADGQIFETVFGASTLPKAEAFVRAAVACTRVLTGRNPIKVSVETLRGERFPSQNSAKL